MDIHLECSSFLCQSAFSFCFVKNYAEWDLHLNIHIREDIGKCAKEFDNTGGIILVLTDTWTCRNPLENMFTSTPYTTSIVTSFLLGMKSSEPLRSFSPAFKIMPLDNCYIKMQSVKQAHNHYSKRKTRLTLLNHSQLEIQQ